MFKKIKLITQFLLVSILLFPGYVYASGPIEKMKSVASKIYNINPSEISLSILVGAVISMILGLLGVIFLSLIIYAGIIWMTAAGNENKVIHSRDTIKRAVVGLIIVVSAYAISQFVIHSLL